MAKQKKGGPTDTNYQSTRLNVYKDLRLTYY